jgi:glutathione S-transferase
MDLYFSPLACSMATRISFYEAGVPANFIGVDTRAGRVENGSDFLAINPLGQVPVLRTDEGELLAENAAVLQYVADHVPQAELAPQGGMARYRLQQWLNFTTSGCTRSFSFRCWIRRFPKMARRMRARKPNSVSHI